MIGKILARALPLALLWWVLAQGAPESAAVGVVTVGLAAAVSVRLQPGMLSVSPWQVVPFILFFLRESVRGGVQVALLALRPGLDLRPGTLEVALRLPHEPARVLLAALVGLMPGTLAIGLEGNLLRLHVLHRDMGAERGVRMAEDRLARLLKLELA